MEWLLDAVGAVMGKTGCRDMVACRLYSRLEFQATTVYRAFEWEVFKNQSDQDWKIAAEQAAGCSGKIQQAGSYSKWVLKVIAMLGESLVPEPAREFFNVVSAAVSNISFAFTWP